MKNISTKKMIFIVAIALVVAIAAGAGIAAYRDSHRATETPSATPTPAEKITVKIYFASSALDPEITCQKVFPVSRTISQTVAIGTAALAELLKGPTSAEKANGYSTALPDGAHLKSLVIRNGTAIAEFDESLEQGVGGSCRVGLIRRQITETLMQFPTITSVVISINGRTEDILQP